MPKEDLRSMTTEQLIELCARIDHVLGGHEYRRLPIAESSSKPIDDRSIILMNHSDTRH
jgi:hypothetical protein